MTDVKWELSGQYAESCSCDYLCPCISSNAQAKPTHGDCFAALLFRVDRGRHEAISLDGLSFGLALWTPTNMAAGGGKFALVIDENASPEQAAALETIGRGDAGGSPAGIKRMAQYSGSVRAPIAFEIEGNSRTVSAGNFLRFHVDGTPSMLNPEDTLWIDGVMHPASSRLALARATYAGMSVLGLEWKNDAGGNNGHLAPFAWQG